MTKKQLKVGVLLPTRHVVTKLLYSFDLDHL